MGIEDFVRKAKQQIVSHEKIEEITDSVLDKVEQVANSVSGDRFAAQVRQARDQIDGALGEK